MAAGLRLDLYRLRWRESRHESEAKKISILMGKTNINESSSKECVRDEAREILKGESTDLVGNLMWEDRKWVVYSRAPRFLS